MGVSRAAVFISGRGSNMDALIAAAAMPGFPAAIALVLSNRADAAGLARAEAAGIATAVVDHRGRDRAAFEAEIESVLADARIDLVCLAGFMRLLTPGFVERRRDRMLNIHPSLLPAFKGLDTHARALAAGVRLHGCTVHLVRPAMDDGPILAQAATAIRDGEDAAALAGRVLALEHRLYPQALGWLAEGRVSVRGDAAIVRAVAADARMLFAP